MAPIRVGIVGLSASGGGSGWAKMAHLPYLKASPNYEITGVLNSSTESSQEAINTFELSSAKPFESIDAMAKDPNIDLITVCVEVAKHAPIVKAALSHGKHVYSEWPLARSAEEAQELASLAAAKGVRGYVGLESRLSPVSVTLQDLISSGAIGKVLSTDVTATLGPLLEVWSEKALFYLNVESGQCPLHTRVGHFLDALCYTVGEFESFTPLLATHNKEVKVYGVPVQQLAVAAKDPNTKYRVAGRTAPDEVLLSGRLESGAISSVHIRSGISDSGGNNLRWLITGSEGLIEVTQKTGQFLRDKSVEIKVVKGEQINIVDIDWQTSGEFEMLGEAVVFATPGRNYKAIAEKTEEAIIDFDHAVRRHKMLDDIVKRGMGTQRFH